MNKIILLGLVIMVGIFSCQYNHKKDEENSDNLLELSDTLKYSTPEEVGMSSAKVKEAENLFIKAAKEEKVIGYQILVARKGKVVLHGAGGLKDYENKLPMEKNTLLNVASNTKSLTAVSILKLADEGKISLDDFVSKYLPGFDSLPSSKITIKHLLLHQGGYTRLESFHGGVPPTSPDDPEAPRLKVEAKELGLFGPEVEPGTMFRYNNLGYNVLGAIIEEVSQMKLDKYFKENIYKPLGMKETSHFMKDVDTSRVSKQYYFYNGKWVRMETLSTPIARGSGGTISKAWDFAKFFQMLVNNGTYNNQKILEEKTVIEATSPLLEVSEAYLSEEIEKGMGLPSSEWYEYRDARDLNIDKHRGYGFVVSDNGGFSHAGIFGTYAYADLNKELVIIIFTQSIYGGNPGQKFIETIYDAIIK
jgi:CubicO group peptidase (beta-lactamase class C family)